MARQVIAVIIGLTAAFAINWTIMMTNYNLHPLPPGIDLMDMEAMTEHMKTLPALAFIVVLIGHLLGAFAAGWIASILADRFERKIAIGLGIFFTVMGIFNLVRIPHPTWFMILDILGYVPAALLGYWMYLRTKK